MQRVIFALGLTLAALGGCGDDASSASGTTGSGAAGASSAGGAGAGQGAGGAGAAGGAASGGGGAGAAGGAGATGGGGAGGRSGGCVDGSGTPGDTSFTIQHDGDDRSYRVHAPPSYDGATPLPVVLVLHGYTETADQIETITKMTPEADARSYIAVYAQGLSNSWNAGACCGSSQFLGKDDVGFLLAMIDEIAADYCVDESRIFSSGFSAGGMLSHRLACEAADRIAAIGTVAGPMAIADCNPTRPVPVMHFHGTSDFVVPYDGGGLSNAESVADTIAGWVARNGCASPAMTTFSQGDAHCETNDGCTDGATVTLCTLEGGGHQWPGGESAGPGGEINMDIFASAAMLDFFDAHPMP